jgi:predicted metal-dependent hydrolase
LGNPDKEQQEQKKGRGYEVVVHRSPRRKTTIEAKLVGEELHIYLPAGLPKSVESRWISKMKSRIESRFSTDSDELLRYLEKRANALNGRYFNGKLRWRGIKITRSSKTMYGSCSPDTKEIRVSVEIRHFPRWVQDYILIHELAHLVEPSHGDRFWKLVNRYEKAELAKGYLMGWAQRGVADGKPA